MPRALEPFLAVVADIKPDRLDAATPCAEYDVRGLVNHLLYWGPSLAGAGRKENVPPPKQPETEIDLTAGDWAADLTAQAEATAAAWSNPGAWEGTAHMGGPTELPARMIGGMVFAELVIHAWDLGRATGAEPHWDTDVLEFTLGEATGMAPQGRDMGVFGPEVAVPADAPLLHRILGVTGRDPL